MKSKVTKLLAILLTLSLLIPALVSAETVSLAIKGGALNLRKGPGTEYTSLGTVKNGDHIVVLEKGSVWSKVKTDSGKKGYIKNLYIKSGDKDYASGTTYVDSYTVYTTGNVNFRAGAGTNTKSMGVLKKGTKLTVLGKNGSFLLVVNKNGTQGFVSKKYVSTSNGGSAKSDTKTVTAYAVNLRADPNTSAKILKVLKKGATVKVLKEGAKWANVDYKGTTGWVSKKYLK